MENAVQIVVSMGILLIGVPLWVIDNYLELGLQETVWEYAGLTVIWLVVTVATANIIPMVGLIYTVGIGLYTIARKAFSGGWDPSERGRCNILAALAIGLVLTVLVQPEVELVTVNETVTSTEEYQVLRIEGYSSHYEREGLAVFYEEGDGQIKNIVVSQMQRADAGKDTTMTKEVVETRYQLAGLTMSGGAGERYTLYLSP